MVRESSAFVVLDCVITHLPTSLYTEGGSQLAGFAAAKCETNKNRAFELFGGGGGYEFLLQAGEALEALA